MEQKNRDRPVILEIHGLSVTFTQYGKGVKQTRLPVIREMDLCLRAGEMTAVVGASGSGKSLLAHAVFGILPYNAQCLGELYFCGERLTPSLQKRLRGNKMVLVPQSVSYLDPLMTVGEQVCRGRKDGEVRARAGKVLNRYGLEADTQKLYPSQLSGGMIRRVLISTAVMEEPLLVVADEPTPGLHPEAAKRVLSHFREIADQGAAVLLITHDLELAVKSADRVVVLYGGTTVEEAAASDFQEESRLRHPFTKALFRAMPEHGFVVSPGNQPYVKDLPVGCIYGTNCPWRGDACGGAISYRREHGGFVRCVRSAEEES